MLILMYQTSEIDVFEPIIHDHATQNLKKIMTEEYIAIDQTTLDKFIADCDLIYKTFMRGQEQREKLEHNRMRREQKKCQAYVVESDSEPDE